MAHFSSLSYLGSQISRAHRELWIHDEPSGKEGKGNVEQVSDMGTSTPPFSNDRVVEGESACVCGWQDHGPGGGGVPKRPCMLMEGGDCNISNEGGEGLQSHWRCWRGWGEGVGARTLGEGQKRQSPSPDAEGRLIR